MAAFELDVPDAAGCPYLGLAADRRTRFTFPHPGQRCFATRPPSTILQAHQAAFCLSASHTACDRYRAVGPPAEVAVLAEQPLRQAAGHLRARFTGEPPESAVDTNSAVDTDVDVTRPRPRPLAVRIMTGALILLALAAIGFGSVPLLVSMLSGRSGTTASPTESPAASLPVVAASPDISPSPFPGPSAATSPIASAAVSAAPSATPRATAVTHIVRSGETLQAIAAAYGVTIQQIVKANGIVDPNRIVTGQHLIIPPPAT